MWEQQVCACWGNLSQTGFLSGKNKRNAWPSCCSWCSNRMCSLSRLSCKWTKENTGEPKRPFNRETETQLWDTFLNSERCMSSSVCVNKINQCRKHDVFVGFVHIESYWCIVVGVLSLPPSDWVAEGPVVKLLPCEVDLVRPLQVSGITTSFVLHRGKVDVSPEPRWSSFQSSLHKLSLLLHVPISCRRT